MQLPVLDQTVRFTCNSCGACCDAPWRTVIEADRAEALLRHDFSRYPQLRGRTFFLPAADGRPGCFDLAKGEDNRCLFLDADGLCIIHKELGPQAKPAMCRQFPYLPVRTPRDDRLSVNYGCPSVQKRLGAALAGQADEIAAVLPRWPPHAAPVQGVSLDAARHLTPDEEDELFARAARLFGDDRFADGRPLDLWARSAELVHLLAVAAAAKGSPPDPASPADGQPSTDEAAAWQCVRAYAAPEGAPLPARLLFAVTLYPDALPAGLTGRLGLMRRFTLLPKLMGMATLRGGYGSRLLGRNVSIPDVLRHPIAAQLDPEATELLLRYFRSRLWLRLPAGTKRPVLAGVHQLIQDFNVIVFLARAIAQFEGGDRLSLDRAARALTLVEFHVANQERVSDHVLKGWLGSMLGGPAVAMASLRLMALQPATPPTPPTPSRPAAVADRTT